jgi:hypothetical protein
MNPQSTSNTRQTETRYTLRNRALAFAARAHREQARKGTDKRDMRPEDLDNVDKFLGSSVPYVMHPAAVGMLLLDHQASDDVVVAGILHDVLEDTKVVTREFLEQTFGSEVTHLVIATSESDKTLPWLPRKEHTIEYFETANVNTKLIAAATNSITSKAFSWTWRSLARAFGSGLTPPKKLKDGITTTSVKHLPQTGQAVSYMNCSGRR